MFVKIEDKNKNLIVLHGHYESSDDGSKCIQAVKLEIVKFSLKRRRKKSIVDSNGDEFLASIEVISLSGRSQEEILLIV